MKNLSKLSLFLFIISLMSLKSTAQAIDIKARESYFVKLYDRANSLSMEQQELQDSLYGKFSDEFMGFIKKNPLSIDYPFKGLSTLINIKTSDDNNFRIYSWDIGGGGTMHYFSQIFQFKSGGRVFTFTPKLEEGDPGEYCSKIIHLKTSQKNYYLPITNQIGSSKDLAQSISCYTIEGNSLSDSTRIFKTKTRFIKRIDVGYDFFKAEGHSERPIEVIKYDPKEMNLYIAIVNKDYALTKNYFVYKFNGKYFEYMSKELKK